MIPYVEYLDAEALEVREDEIKYRVTLPHTKEVVETWIPRKQIRNEPGYDDEVFEVGEKGTLLVIKSYAIMRGLWPAPPKGREK